MNRFQTLPGGGFYTLVLVFLCAFNSSCVNSKKAIYFNSQGDEEIELKADLTEPVLQKNDLLDIVITSPNPAATQFFNTANTIGTQTLGYVTTQASGFLIDQDGSIDFPILGKVKAAGLTKKQLKEAIITQLTERKLLYDPVVSIRYLNFKVTVLGEVGKPMVINVPDEKISVLEALGLAGEMTVYAKRDNVMLIREESGKRVVKRLNLNASDFLSSPYYFLKSNDVIYVEPNNARVASAGNGRIWLPAVLSAMSFVAVIVSRIVQ